MNLLFERESHLGCTIRLFDVEHNDGAHLLLTLDMRQPGDGRHAEVVLNRDDALELSFALQEWV